MWVDLWNVKNSVVISCDFLTLTKGELYGYEGNMALFRGSNSGSKKLEVRRLLLVSSSPISRFFCSTSPVPHIYYKAKEQKL